MINCTYLVPFRQSSEKQLDFTQADVLKNGVAFQQFTHLLGNLE